MHCTRVKIGQTTAIVCHGGRRPRGCACGKTATLACDWVIGRRGKRITRCSAPLCEGCATCVGPDKHLCPAHLEAWDRHPKNPHGAPEPPSAR